jgi:hypothetical protein
MKAREQGRKVDWAECLDGADREVSAHESADGGDRVSAVLGRGDGTPGGSKQRSAGLGQLDLTGATDEPSLLINTAPRMSIKWLQSPTTRAEGADATPC